MSGLTAALHTAVSGLDATEKRLQNSASNLARVSSASAKKTALLVIDRAYRNYVTPGSSTSEAGTVNPTGYQVGTGVEVLGNYENFEQGDRITTGRALDVYIDGDGFLPVTLPDGTEAYTRVGNLQVDNTGRLVMPGTGYPLVPNINFPSNATAIDINDIGEIYTTVDGGSTLLGQLQLTTFLNSSGLKNLGRGLYKKSNASGEPDQGIAGTGKRGKIVQFSYEGSNIQAVDEMVELVKIEKDYSAITKVLKTGEKMWEASNAINV